MRRERHLTLIACFCSTAVLKIVSVRRERKKSYYNQSKRTKNLAAMSGNASKLDSSV